MNEVEYCTGCAISMIITCKIDYSIFSVTFNPPLLLPLLFLTFAAPLLFYLFPLL